MTQFLIDTLIYHTRFNVDKGYEISNLIFYDMGGLTRFAPC
jgi:hypothetical protein